MAIDKTTLLMCIGAQKAGTTWLGKQLQNHPTIFTPPIKEIHHFDSIHRRINHKARNRRIVMYKRHIARMANIKFKNDNYFKTTQWLYNFCVTQENNDDWYHSLFDFENNVSNGKTVFIDNTPEYSILDRRGLVHIKRIHPNVKICFLMREPKSRTWSAIKYFSKNNPEKSLLESSDKMMQFINEKGNTKRSDYLTILNNVESVFSKGNIIYEFYENIFDSTTSQLKFLKQLCEFLRIDFKDEYFTSTLGERVNASSKDSIPKEIDLYLTNFYKEQNKKMKTLFKDKLPDSWL